MNTEPERGFALMTVLLITVPLLMILGAALALSGHGSFNSLLYQDQMEAFYAAEAGVVYAIEQLEDPTGGSSWTPSNLRVDMPNGRASFQISFGPSVNNLENSAAVDGPRGPDSVPPDSVDLIVIGRAGAVERKLEAIIERRGTIRIEEPILASGRIELSQTIQIAGTKDIDEWEDVPVGIHSNLAGNIPNTVTWTGGAVASGTAKITGDITAVSEHSSAIVVDGLVGGELLVDEQERLVKDYDVEGEISLHSSAPAPPAPDADGIVTLSGGNYYVSGDLAINGKLVLDNANLYLADGDLSVTGSISGAGSIYVDGDTHFRGDATLKIADPNFDEDPDLGVGLFSTGDITLSGFNGDEYMNDLVSSLSPSHPTSLAWSDSKRALDEMVGMLDTHTWSGFDQATKDEFDSTRRVLGQTLPNPIPAWASDQGQMRKLADALEGEPPTPTRDFLIEKFRETADTFDSPGAFYSGSSNQTAEAALHNYILTGDKRGVIDASLDIRYDGVPSPLDNVFRSTSAYVEQLQSGGLGQSYFQGVIYTEGRLVAGNQITVVGGIIANGGERFGSGPQPGDVSLLNGATIIFPVDLFRYGRGVGGTGQLGVRSWINH